MQPAIIRKLAGLIVAIFVAGQLSAQAGEKQDFEAAKQEYEQSSRDEVGRLRYVNKLAQIIDRLLRDYARSDERNDDLHRAINSELQKHPSPKEVDSKKLRQLLVGEWASPRRIYVYRANGKWGSEDDPVANNWRIQDNQLIEDGSRGTIILLNADYFIYADSHGVFFHSRVKD